MVAHDVDVTRQLAELQQRLAMAESRLDAAGCKLGRSRMWARAAVLLAVCGIVGVVFLDESPAAPPPGVPAATLVARITALEAKTEPLSVDGDDFIITGKNVHIVDGTGLTDSGTGLGNLTIGYNELRADIDDPDVRTGTHNLILGAKNNYSGFGGLVAGLENEISGDYTVVSGGLANTASDFCTSVSGGVANTASEFGASVSGGEFNTASDRSASVSGGRANTASGHQASVSGGSGNEASGTQASVSGGDRNEATTFQSTVSGGGDNVASGTYSTVSGGRDNVSSGFGSTVSGGRFRTAADDYDWVAGSLVEDD